ncbi:hypothetical protein [Ruminococcus sp. Marseille-P6503]|uniref:hypothetical protein n=1 Tax=Ruminococcus sp. Marseille-P6503 TaxID=2364796 RepID=UPI000F53BD93|nr:hypothetical protein [Ruminococcus sp. Marseille-P6503]
MRGDIIYVDYELSSWKYLNNKSYYKQTNPILTYNRKCDIIKMGYVCKGGGSAYGGDWRPKDENSKRFFGEPNTIKINYVKGNKGGYKVMDKYNSEGKAIKERHLTDHNKSNKHTDPHDHEISWDNNRPDFSSPINYPNGSIPEFKKYDIGVLPPTPENDYNPDDYKFETLGEFKLYLLQGCNVGFEWHGVEYGIEGHNNSFDIWIYDKEDIAEGLTLEQTLDFEFDGVKLRDLITSDEVIIIERIA